MRLTFTADHTVVSGPWRKHVGLLGLHGAQKNIETTSNRRDSNEKSTWRIKLKYTNCHRYSFKSNVLPVQYTMQGCEVLVKNFWVAQFQCHFLHIVNAWDVEQLLVSQTIWHVAVADTNSNYWHNSGIPNEYESCCSASSVYHQSYIENPILSF